MLEIQFSTSFQCPNGSPQIFLALVSMLPGLIFMHC